ncbi:MAG: hypothetical protein IPM24_22670 [Bryobacterales bacterium]|nr:hypothetical protein [Bryobacterales bacterium]
MAERFIWLLSILVRSAVVGKLASQGLHRQYPWFYCYWILTVLRSASLFGFSSNSPHYYSIWLWSEPVLWVFSVLVIVELYRVVLAEFAGIYSLARWFFVAAVAVSVGVSLMSLASTWGAPTAPHHVFFLVKRGLSSSMALFLLLLLALLVWMPVPLRRNVVYHCSLYSVYFTSTSLALLYRSVTGSSVSNTVSWILLCIDALCQVGWFFLLSRAGEEIPEQSKHRHLSRHEEALLGQLRNINGVLLRAGKGD